MIFDEKKFITLEKYENIFIYFLIKEREVVYVGKTTKGILRPLSHTNKIYDEIKIIYCEEDELDTLENKYIIKYKPIYNKEINHNELYSLNQIVLKIKEQNLFDNFNLWKLKKIVKYLNIETKKFKEKQYICKNDFEKIINLLGGNYGTK